LKEGGGENQNLPEASIEESQNDIEELASTNECYRQKGREEWEKTLIHLVFHREVLL
jgi:hypothetical protein